ncbi:MULTISPECIES: Crp/Fnr family transcriptional regulator [unclassified Duganella]|uniref:Crp/Fnr family transcriptional regulator n=1 Tax=unclassified Duganella TaxID=2636909 RepID=UPI0013EE96D6|nr:MULTISPECIES: Crp/Fnr family transcriptional regulator [unclassified Duganella]
MQKISFDTKTSTSDHLPAARAAPPPPSYSSSLAELCSLLNMSVDLRHHHHFRLHHVRLHRDQQLYLAGQPCRQLYVVKTGFLKAVLPADTQRPTVVGFPMRGSLVGVEGIASGHHTVEVTALSDCELVVLPLDTLALLSRECVGLSRSMCFVMAGELARELSISKRRGLSAKARVGRFLLDWSERFANMGYARNTFNLPMSRGDMGSYLGMALETATRALLALEHEGLISTNYRTVCIHDRQALLTLKRMPRQRCRPD